MYWITKQHKFKITLFLHNWGNIKKIVTNEGNDKWMDINQLEKRCDENS